MSASLDGRDINELRVVDLKAELEKRGLDKSGNKQVLLERLQKAIDDVKGQEEEKNASKDSADNPLNGTDKSMEDMSSDILDLNASLETVEKKVNLEDITEAKEAAKDTAPKEDEAEASDKKHGAAGMEACAAQVKQEADKSLELALHDEALEDGTRKADARPEPEEDVEEVDGDVDLKPEAENGADEAPAAASTNGTTPGGAEEKRTTAAAAKKDGKKEAADEKSSTSPSKIKERLANDQNRNLWITNISQTTRATELKQALSEHGKVVGAKVVINARHPAACCYGYVRMETVADADNCIAKLNNTELNGQIIRIEKVRPDHLNPSAKAKVETPAKEKPTQRTPVRAPTPIKEEAGVKKERKPVEAPPKDDKKEKQRSSTGAGATAAVKVADKDKDKPKEKEKEKAKESETKEKDAKPAERKERRRTRSRSKTRSEGRNRSLSTTARHQPAAGAPRREVPAVRKEKDILTFDKIKTERERERLREREREMRMRRREESERVKEIERRQRSEEARLERERQKIKEERERLERERAELLALERERQKREREKIELERLELQRAKQRMQEEERRAVKRPAPSSGGGRFSERDRERSYEERKRPAAERHFAEAPPPPRFDAPSSIKTRDASPQIKKFSSSSTSKDYSKRLSYDKRDAYPPKRDYDERANMSRSSGGGSGSGAVPKYESTSSSSYARDRDLRTADPRGSGSASSGNVRNSSSSGIGAVSSSKYNSSDSKVRYSERERERDRSPHFNSRSIRADDRDRRPVGVSKDIRSSRDHRYPEPKVDSVRYDRTSSSSGATWSQHKTFTPTNSSASKPWSKDAWRSSENTPSTGERSWAANTSRPGIPFSSNPSMALGPSCPPPPGINTYVNDRFDYKSNMSSMRKY